MSQQLISILSTSAGVIAAMMLVVWLISLVMKDASIVDLVWGFGFVLVGWASFLTAKSDVWLLPVLTSLWGLRLTIYLAWRNHGQPEDYRYRGMRERHGRSFPLVSMLTVFGLQGVIMWVVSLPIQAGAIGTNTVLHWLQIPGIALWGTGLFFEAVGDWQLARHKANPASVDRVLDTGLWRYTRHPNYFGDFVVWWGLYLIAVSASGAWWTVIGPIVISVFLMRVSGVTLLEKSLKQKKPRYGDYISRTNAFFPGLPRSSK